MIRNLNLIIGQLTLISALVGCASQPKLPPTKADITPVSKTMVFSTKKVSSDQINVGRILATTAKTLQETSSVGALRYTGDPKTILDAKGLKATVKKEGIGLEYINGEKFSSGNFRLTKSTATLQVKTEEKEDSLEITLSTPPFIETSIGYGVFGGAYSPLGSDSALAEDVYNIVSNLPATTITLTEDVKGDLNSEFNDESIFANFERNLGRYKYRYGQQETKKFDIKKDKVYALTKESGEKIPLKIEVYPYRNGSKVVYEFDYSYPYSGIDSEVDNAKSTVKNLVEQITKVVND